VVLASAVAGAPAAAAAAATIGLVVAVAFVPVFGAAAAPAVCLVDSEQLAQI
jgi:hypothetical protein